MVPMNVSAPVATVSPVMEHSVLVSANKIPSHCVCYALFSEIDECSEGTSNCDHICINTNGSYTCDCDSGHLLQPDGHTCQCGGPLTAASGSFQTPDWPTSYPFENFQCEWFIELPNSAATIEFTIDDSAFGIKGRPPSCPTDHIEFFDGNSSNADSLNMICGLPSSYNTLPITTTTSSVARVVFTGSDNSRPSSRVGVKVDYVTVPPIGIYIMQSLCVVCPMSVKFSCSC